VNPQRSRWGDRRDIEKREVKVWKRLDKVIGPHTKISVVEMKLVTGIELRPDGKGFKVTVNFRPDTPACPVLDELRSHMARSVEKLRWVTSAEVVVTMPEGA